MKLVRFMSFSEFEKLMNGEVLENKDNHVLEHTNSVGFCFFDIDYDDLEELRNEIGSIFEYASGIVSKDVAVVFGSRNTELKKRYGVYASPYIGIGSFSRTEYSTVQYDYKTLKPLHFATGRFYSDVFAEKGEEYKGFSIHEVNESELISAIEIVRKAASG